MTDASRADALHALLREQAELAQTVDPTLTASVNGYLARPLVPAARWDAAFVVAFLRCERRWRHVGLAKPPDHDFWTHELDYLWPTLRTARVAVSLVLHAGAVVAVALDAGLADDRDRVRLVQMVAVGGNPLPGRDQIWVWDALLHSLKGRRGHRVLVPVPDNNTLELVSPTPGSGLDLRAGLLSLGARPRALAHLATLELSLAARVTPPPPDREVVKNSLVSAVEFERVNPQRRPPTLSAKRLGALASPEIQVRNPAFAHLQLGLGRSPMRPLRYPEKPTESKDLVIIGAGVSGAAAAYLVRDRDVLVLDRDDRVGGTGACQVAADGQTYPLAAHYECDLGSNYGQEVIDFYKELEFIRSVPEGPIYPFVESQYYVNSSRSEQAILADGQLRSRGWRLFSTDATAMRFRDLVVSRVSEFPLPTRNSLPSVRALQHQTFARWLKDQGLHGGGELRRSLEVLLRSDYGGLSQDVSAFAGLHYFACRPYFTTGTRTFSPPEGLAYFAKRMLARAPRAEVRLNQMVVRLKDRQDHVEVCCLDLVEHVTRRYLAKAVIFAAPKKPVPYLFSQDRALFAKNRYAAWMTLSFEFRHQLPEAELLYWANHVAEPSGEHVGFTWANHHQPDAPPIITAYVALRPGKASHLKALWSMPGPLVRRSLRLLACLLGRDVTADVGRVVVQKLGHAMPTPVPDSLFTDPNGHRRCERLLYAGVDTGRLPLLAEAIDSAQQAVRLLP